MTETKDAKKTRDRRRKWVAFALVASLFILLWVGTTVAILTMVTMRAGVGPSASLGDMAAVLFGASSLVLILITLLFAFAAIFGWPSLKEQVRKEIEAGYDQRIHALEQELRGRVETVLGHTLGLLSTEPTRWTPLDKNRLRQAVEKCQTAYDLLQDLGEKPKFMALNNLVYYSAVLDDQARAQYLLKQARLLRKAGQKHNAWHLVLTYCRTVLQFSTYPQELENARSIAKELAEAQQCSQAQREEARFYLASFDKTPEQRATAD